jgi:hypothetical protein
VGRTAHTAAVLKGEGPGDLGDEGFWLKTAGPHVVVLGSNVRGAMYGCSALLEKLGVRWWTSKVTYTPLTRTLVVPELDEVQRPAFEYREVYITEAFDKDFAARQRLNGQHHQLDESTGGAVRYGGHFVHTFDALVPPAMFAAHPDYFPLIKGKRTSGYVQRCLTNPDVLKLATAKVLEWIEKEPAAQIYSVSQNDTYNFCECDECRKIESEYGGQHSGVYLWFVNQLAETIEKKYPGKLIDTLAYQFTEAAPTGIKPRANVRVRLCPIGACEAHPYETCDAKPTVAFMKNLRGWGQLTDTLYVWHYNTDFGHYLMPFPDFNEFPADIRLYARSGVRGIFFEGAYGRGGGGSFGELQAYVMAKMLWDPKVDDRRLVREWHLGVYGPAAGPAMLEWFELLHAKAADPKAHFFVYSNPKNAPHLTADVIAKGDEIFDRAEAAAKANPAALEAVQKARLTLRYTKLYQNPTTGAAFTSFLEDLKKHEVGEMREGVLTEAWAAEFRKRHAGK